MGRVWRWTVLDGSDFLVKMGMGLGVVRCGLVSNWSTLR